MRAVVAVLLIAAGCAPPPPVVEEPLTVSAEPPPGPFTDRLTVTLTASRPATVYASSNGRDPRSSSVGRVQADSVLEVELTATTTLRYFASANAKDGPLAEGEWVRAGGVPGTISGVVVAGAFAAGMRVAVSRGGEVLRLGRLGGAGELPFSFKGVPAGTHSLVAWVDLNDDGQLWPALELSSPRVSVTLDLSDPFHASAEDVRLYLAASAPAKGTLRGTITLPSPPLLQSLQISALSPDALVGLQGSALLELLRGGYRVLTNAVDTTYPYVITDLEPGEYIPIPSLIGLGAGGAAVNTIVNPIRPVTIVAGQETVADFTFGPVTLTGDVTVRASGGTPGFTWGAVAARAVSFTEGGQAVVMPVVFSKDTATSTLRASYGAEAVRGNADVALRVFTNLASSNPIADALAWAALLGTAPAHATVHTGTGPARQDIAVP